MMFELVSAIASDQVRFEAPNRAIAALVIIGVGWPCDGATGLTNAGRQIPEARIPNPWAPGFMDWWTGLGDGPYLGAYRRHRSDVIHGLASMHRTSGAPPVGLIDVVAEAHGIATLLRAGAGLDTPMREAAE